MAQWLVMRDAAVVLGNTQKGTVLGPHHPPFLLNQMTPTANPNFLLHVPHPKMLMPVVNAPDCPLLRIPPVSGDKVLLEGVHPRGKHF